MKQDHPMQPVYLDKHGVARFKENKIVRYMLDRNIITMNRDDIGNCVAMEGVLSNYLQRIKNLRESDDHDFINHTLACAAWDKLMEFERILKEIEEDIPEYEE